MRRFMLVTAVLLLTLTATAACGTNQTQNSKRYAEDGYLGITNSNPNLQTSPAYHTYRKDVRMMAQTLRGVPGVQDARVALNGDRANIRILVDERLSPEEAHQIERAAYNALLPVVPRYHIQVTSNVNR